MPQTIRTFAESALVDPVVVNVGRAGAANLDVIQEVEYVKQEAKVLWLRGYIIILYYYDMATKIINTSMPSLSLPFTNDYSIWWSIQYFDSNTCMASLNQVLYLLECLQKTAPPVLIFAENKKDVDDIHEYLLLKGI